MSLKNIIHSLLFICLLTESLICCEQPRLKAEEHEKSVNTTISSKSQKHSIQGIKTSQKDPSIPSMFAGKFYPADKIELTKQLDEYFSKIKPQYVSNIWGIVSPHAGYDYSGKVAATAFKEVMNKPIKTVIVIAFSHNPNTVDGKPKHNGIATIKAPFFKIPSGAIEVDIEEVNKILDGYPFIKESRELFLNEHSLEVQLPFIKRALPNAKLVPLMFGANSNLNQAKMLASMLVERYAIRSDCLVVATTDMSHYFSYYEANKMDKRALDLVASLKNNELKKLNDSGEIQFCGIYPLLSMVLAQKQLFDKAPFVLDYKNSGDTANSKDKVVGYSAIAFSRPSKKRFKNIEKIKEVPMEYTLTDDQKKSLLKLARETVEIYVKDRVKPDFKIDDSMLLQSGAAFVTLEINGKLRGCIGHTEARLPLWQCVRDMAIAASTQDPRFPPVTESDLDKLNYEISVLTPMEKIDSVDNIQVGRDGLMMEKGFYRGLLLPQVPVEWGWNREQFLNHTAEKAGLPADAWRDGSVTIYSFQGLIFNDEQF